MWIGRWSKARATTTRSSIMETGSWDMECHLTGGGPELVREVERYRLEIVGLTSTHSLGSGAQLLEKGGTLFYSGVAHGERRRAGVGLFIAPQLSRHVLEFSLVNERVASLHLRVGIGLSLLFVLMGHGSGEYPAFLGSLGGMLEGASDWGLGRSTGGLQCQHGQGQ